MPIVLPATAALPKPVRMRTSPIHDAVSTKILERRRAGDAQDAAHHVEVERQMRRVESADGRRAAIR